MLDFLLILILARNNTTFAVFSAPVVVTQLPPILPYRLATGNKHRNRKSSQISVSFLSGISIIQIWK